MRRILVGVMLVLLLAPAVASAGSITFTAADVKTWMAAQGAPLNDADDQWGLWAVRVMLNVSGGGYTVTGGSTTQEGWGVFAPNGAFGAAPYTAANSAWFWDASGAPGYAANPLYMIMDRPADSFESYFGNTVTGVNDASVFNVYFSLDPGAVVTGWQFVVDGSRYTLGTAEAPGGWETDFFGGYGSGGDLPKQCGRRVRRTDVGCSRRRLHAASPGRRLHRHRPAPQENEEVARFSFADAGKGVASVTPFH